MHGFSSGTVVHDIAEDDDGRELIVLYVGDFDPSGMFMSEEDLPTRLAEYGGDHITVKRIALTRSRCAACRRSRQPTRRRTRATTGSSPTTAHDCWELDAMDPNDLRDCVEQAIVGLIEPVAWQRCEVVNKAEQESLQTVLEQWGVRHERHLRPLTREPQSMSSFALRPTMAGLRFTPGSRGCASPSIRCATSGAGFLPEDTRSRPSSPSDMIFPGPR